MDSSKIKKIKLIYGCIASVVENQKSFIGDSHIYCLIQEINTLKYFDVHYQLDVDVFTN